MAAAERFDPYNVLGVQRDATPTQLARAYRLQAKRFHPDLHGPNASRQMRDLNRSWQILSDPERRRRWDAAHPPVTALPHWAGSPRPGPADPPPSTPGSWATWTASRPHVVMGRDRVTVADTWPRPRVEAPPAPVGLRDSGWLAAGVAGMLVLAIVALGWVASTGRAAASPRDAFGALGVVPSVALTLDSMHVAALYLAGDGQLGVVTARLGERGWQARVLEERAAAGELTVRLASDDSGSGWRSLVYGRAPNEVERVRLSVAFVGGEVSNGMWLIGVRAPLRPEQVKWRMEGSGGGSVLLTGSGELH